MQKNVFNLHLLYIVLELARSFIFLQTTQKYQIVASDEKNASWDVSIHVAGVDSLDAVLHHQIRVLIVRSEDTDKLAPVSQDGDHFAYILESIDIIADSKYDPPNRLAKIQMDSPCKDFGKIVNDESIRKLD